MYKAVKIVIVASLVFALAAHSPVQAQTTTLAADSELKALVAQLKKEIDVRIVETDKALKALKDSSGASSAAKDAVTKSLEASKKTLLEFKSQLETVKTLSEAQALAKKIDAQFNQYASANVSAATLKDSSAQQQVQKQLSNVANNAQSMIDLAGANDMNVGNVQKAMKGLRQLVESIAAIIASIVALIASLATGTFSNTGVIFQTIAGQLSQNLVAIDAAQNSLAGIVDTLGAMQITGDTR